MLERLKSLVSYFFKPADKSKPKEVRAASSIDAVRTDELNEQHFSHAHLASADAHASEPARREVRKIVRYEYLNNPVLKGVVLTRANSIVGKGPRMILPGDPNRLPGRRARDPGTSARREKRAKAVAQSISKKFNTWVQSINLGEKLRQMVKAKLVDGESFLAFIASETIEHPIKFTARVFDCDRVTDSWGLAIARDGDWVDGIRYDEATGDPLEYRILKHHPYGEYIRQNEYNFYGDGDYHHEFDRSRVFHFFRKDFGEQHRGLSELASSVDIAAIIRRVRRAIAAANETAASLAGVATSDFEADEDDEIELPEAFASFPIVPNQLLNLPNKMKIQQMEAKHPTTQYNTFHDSCVGEIGHSIGMPFNKASGSSASYNFSSAMLDGIQDLLSCEIERDIIRKGCLDKAFRLFVAFGLNTGFFSATEELYLLSGGELPKAQWFFETEGNEIDPHKQMKAKEVSVQLGLTSLTSLLGEQGKDIDEHDAILAKENGITVEELRELRRNANFQVTETESDTQSPEDND